MPRWLIRRATSADLPAIGRLGAILTKTHHDFDPQRFIAATSQTQAGYASYLGTQLNDPDVAVLVADGDDGVVGYAYAGVEGTDYMSFRGPAGARAAFVRECWFPTHNDRDDARVRRR